MAKNGKHGCLWWLLIGWWLVPMMWLARTILSAVKKYRGATVHVYGMHDCSLLDSKKSVSVGTIAAANPSGFRFSNATICTETVFVKETGEITKETQTVYALNNEVNLIRHLAIQMLDVYARTGSLVNVEIAAGFINRMKPWDKGAVENPPRGNMPCYRYRGDKARITVEFSSEDYDPFADIDFSLHGRVTKDGELYDGGMRFYVGDKGDDFRVRRGSKGLELSL